MSKTQSELWYFELMTTIKFYQIFSPHRTIAGYGRLSLSGSYLFWA